MRVADKVVRVMPDIACEAEAHVAGTLDWVGMGEIEMPVLVQGHDGVVIQVPARVTAFVNLERPEVRGIHMSRLYVHLDDMLSTETLSPTSLRNLLDAFLESHSELSDRAMVLISYDYMVRRPALASQNSGWKSYPVTICGLIDKGNYTVELGIDIGYSSTCPCSAALARQLIQEQFSKDFEQDSEFTHQQVLEWLGSEQGICATPHSQRSTAEVRLRLASAEYCFPVLSIIDRIEDALQTPVQGVVKREDEQAFARLNGANLMFCEDAGRRVQRTLNEDLRIADFWARATHFESLHPHNAVSVVTKGVQGGYRAGVDMPAVMGHGGIEER